MAQHEQALYKEAEWKRLVMLRMLERAFFGVSSQNDSCDAFLVMHLIVQRSAGEVAGVPRYSRGWAPKLSANIVQRTAHIHQHNPCHALDLFIIVVPFIYEDMKRH